MRRVHAALLATLVGAFVLAGGAATPAAAAGASSIVEADVWAGNCFALW